MKDRLKTLTLVVSVLILTLISCKKDSPDCEAINDFHKLEIRDAILQKGSDDLIAKLHRRWLRELESEECDLDYYLLSISQTSK